MIILPWYILKEVHSQSELVIYLFFHCFNYCLLIKTAMNSAERNEEFRPLIEPIANMHVANKLKGLRIYQTILNNIFLGLLVIGSIWRRWLDWYSDIFAAFAHKYYCFNITNVFPKILWWCSRPKSTMLIVEDEQCLWDEIKAFATSASHIISLIFEFHCSDFRLCDMIWRAHNSKKILIILNDRTNWPQWDPRSFYVFLMCLRAICS